MIHGIGADIISIPRVERLIQRQGAERFARRILHERAASGRDVSGARRRLRDLFENHPDEKQKLRGLWTLFGAVLASPDFRA